MNFNYHGVNISSSLDIFKDVKQQAHKALKISVESKTRIYLREEKQATLPIQKYKTKKKKSLFYL